MAYLHCHTKDCRWSQDDFWNYNWTWKAFKHFITFKWQKRSFGYNPFSILLEDIHTWGKPRRIKMDSHWLKENGIKGDSVHSWFLLRKGFRRYKNVKKRMVYKTWDAWRKARDNGKPVCPNCGKPNWDMD
jgi:hypothetical protein